ncbi:MAG: hypothetical protein HZB37_13195 [Planctomycetes bacterium]|nr:hypothetical protein [Planctomycetota bacterium]
MPSFVGLWNTVRYAGDNPENPESIQLSINEDAVPSNGNLDGAYARPGQDARMYGALEGNGVMWRAQIDERASSGDEGSAIFFISADGNTIYGAWTSNQHNNGPQPWFGTRI